jgi:hypothetical protein
MKQIILAAAVSLAAVSGAVAQSSTTTTTTTQTTETTGSITPEIRTKVREYITTERPRAVEAPSGVTISVGSTLPEAVELRSFPSSVGVSQYRYTVVGDRTVLVDPGTRRIIQVIE